MYFVLSNVCEFVSNCSFELNRSCLVLSVDSNFPLLSSSKVFCLFYKVYLKKKFSNTRFAFWLASILTKYFVVIHPYSIVFDYRSCLTEGAKFSKGPFHRLSKKRYSMQVRQ